MNVGDSLGNNGLAAIKSAFVNHAGSDLSLNRSNLTINVSLGRFLAGHLDIGICSQSCIGIQIRQRHLFDVVNV